MIKYIITLDFVDIVNLVMYKFIDNMKHLIHTDDSFTICLLKSYFNLIVSMVSLWPTKSVLLLKNNTRGLVSPSFFPASVDTSCSTTCTTVPRSGQLTNTWPSDETLTLRGNRSSGWVRVESLVPSLFRVTSWSWVMM